MQDRSDLLRATLRQLKASNVSPGKKKLQKIIYLLQEKTGHSEYWFGIHLYGPFSADLAKDVDELANYGEVSILLDGMTERIILEADQDLPVLTPEESAVVDTYMQDDAQTLELLSTLVFVSRVEGKAHEALVERLRKLKPKYAPDTVRVGIHRLMEDGLIAG